MEQLQQNDTIITEEQTVRSTGLMSELLVFVPDALLLTGVWVGIIFFWLLPETYPHAPLEWTGGWNANTFSGLRQLTARSPEQADWSSILWWSILVGSLIVVLQTTGAYLAARIPSPEKELSEEMERAAHLDLPAPLLELIKEEHKVEQENWKNAYQPHQDFFQEKKTNALSSCARTAFLSALTVGGFLLLFMRFPPHSLNPIQPFWLLFYGALLLTQCIKLYYLEQPIWKTAFSLVGRAIIIQGVLLMLFLITR
jgi:hypothetical protein